MTRYVVRRLLFAGITLLVISLTVFLLSRATGDPVEIMLDPTATQRDRDLLAHALGLDRPLHVQYYLFVSGALRGDLGRSLTMNRPVLELFVQRLGNTLQLTGIVFALNFVIAVPAGTIAAVFRGRWPDSLTRWFVFLGHGVPNFCLGVVLILLFAVRLRWLPPAGKGGPATFILPLMTMTLGSAAGLTRIVRSSMLDVLPSEYLRTAKAKGLPPTTILWRHALRNALIPIVGYMSVAVRGLVTGGIIIETMFAWPGVGRLAYEAAQARDYPLMQGIVLMIALTVILATFVADLLYGWVDPRIRYS